MNTEKKVFPLMRCVKNALCAIKRQLPLLGKDIARNLLWILFFWVQILFTIIYITIITCFLSGEEDHLRYTEALADEGWYLFETSATTFGTETEAQLVPVLENTDYLMEAQATFTQDGQDYPGLVVLGNFESGLITKNSNDQAFFLSDGVRAILGKNLDGLETGDPLGAKLTVLGRFSGSVLWWSSSNISGLLSANESVVFLADITSWAEYSPYSRMTEPLVQSLRVRGLTEEEAVDLSQRLSEATDSFFVPVSLSDKLLDEKENTEGQRVFRLFFILIALITTAGISINLLSMIRSCQKEYTIHYLYGASLAEICIRVAGYAVAAVAVPWIIGAKLASVLLETFSLTSGGIQISIFLLIYMAAIFAVGISAVLRQEPTEQLRKDGDWRAS